MRKLLHIAFGVLSNHQPFNQHLVFIPKIFDSQDRIFRAGRFSRYGYQGFSGDCRIIPGFPLLSRCDNDRGLIGGRR
jgi:hypothetical protein